MFHFASSKIYKLRENPSLVYSTGRWVKRTDNLSIEKKFLYPIKDIDIKLIGSDKRSLKIHEKIFFYSLYLIFVYKNRS